MKKHSPAKVIKVDDANTLVPAKKFKYAHWPFDEFNPVQSKVFEFYKGDHNVAVAAATSSGKTVMAEMIMSYEIRSGHGKAIYVGPLKALAKEKEQEWTDPSHHFSDMNIEIVTGDYRLTASRIEELEKANIIVMTPEMLASRSRNDKSEKSAFLQQVAVVVFDESHLLTVPSRGDHIEVALMKLLSINPDVRIVLLSATMPNVDEICGWASQMSGRDTYYLESDYRPCPLNVHYEVYYDGDRMYDDREVQKIGTTCGIVEYYPEDKFLIFVHTKRTGRQMVEHLARYGVQAEFHNADLSLQDRLRIEEEFKKKDGLRVIVATSTIAWGCYEHGSRLLSPNGKLIDVADVKEGTELWCPVDELGNYGTRKVVMAESFESKIGYCVRLESGEEVRVSEDHIFYAAVKRQSPDWHKVSEISKGDFLSTPSDTQMWEGYYGHSKFWYLAGFIFGDGSLCDVGCHADGSQKAVLDICLGCRGDLHGEYIKEIFNEEFKSNFDFKYDTNDVMHIKTKRKEIVDGFLSLLPLGRKQGSHDLPNELYGNEVHMSSFLRGLFDADGGVEDHGNGNFSVGLSNISKKLIESVRSVLLGFGIFSSFGKKKVKDSVINGRFQKAVREYSYRLRIFGQDNLQKFARSIGFMHEAKGLKLMHVLYANFNYEKDLIPARELLKKHLEANGMNSSNFQEITGSDLWASLYKQDCRRDTLQKLIESSKDKNTQLSDFLGKPIRWSRVKDIYHFENSPTKYREIEIEDPHVYVGGNVISHNCNLPARRVVIAGVHRGLSVVENYDIFQMVGRAGRPKYDPRGDAYILIPESEKDFWVNALRNKSKIKSTLLDFVGTPENPHYKTLAFHIVSEIHQGNVTTKEGFHEWFKDSLAHYQAQDFDDEIIDKTIALLEQKNAVYTDENGKYQVTAVGKIASMYYYSPFDVSDLKRNFKHLLDKGHENNDHAISLALGNVDTNKWGVVNKHEKKLIDSFETKINREFGDFYTSSAIKYAYVYHNMLKGRKEPAFAAVQGGLINDMDRMMQVLYMIDSMSKWEQKDWFSNLRLRLYYGVESDLVGLIQIPNVGQVRAKRLKNAGITDIDKFLNCNSKKLADIMKCSTKLVGESINGAQEIKLKEMTGM
jgi:replicative superfamily II helicase